MKKNNKKNQKYNLLGRNYFQQINLNRKKTFFELNSKKFKLHQISDLF